VTNGCLRAYSTAPPRRSSRTYSGRAVVFVQMPVTLTVPTTKIKSRINDDRPSANPVTVHTPLVVIQSDGQQGKLPNPSPYVAHPI